MNVWRIHLKSDINPRYDRNDLLEFCKNEKIIGVGWGLIKTKNNSLEKIRYEAQGYGDSKVSAVKAVNAMRKMIVDDLIWTRSEGIYYLCRVTNEWKNRNPVNKHEDYDVSNYVCVEWIRIGMEELIPGKVISSFCPPSTVQRVNDVSGISKFIWNKYSENYYYENEQNGIDIWSTLSSENIEELVLLYLQVCKGYFIYSATVKHNKRKYECVMVDKKGRLAFPQVKSGSLSLNADDYIDAIELNPSAQVYLFATSELYVSNGCPNINFLTKKELEQFIIKYRNIIPELTKNWIDFCKFYEKQ